MVFVKDAGIMSSANLQSLLKADHGCVVTDRQRNLPKTCTKQTADLSNYSAVDYDKRRIQDIVWKRAQASCHLL